MYINRQTGDIIYDDAVLSKTDSGIIFFQDGCWRFLEKEQYEQRIESSGNTYGTTKVYISNTELDELIATTSDIYSQVYTYYFGLNDLVIVNKKYASVSAILSESINVTMNMPLRISSNISVPERSSIEFYVVDGIDEIPLLPIEQSSIVHEKLFFEMPIRFHDGSDFHFFKDFVSMSESRDNLDERNDGSLYTVSYNPPSTAYEYVPKSSSIKIKIILRIYDDSITAPQLTVPTVIQER